MTSAAYPQPAAPSVEGPIPSGTVAFFDRTNCPSGWTELTEARGRVVVGLNGSAGTLKGTIGVPLPNQGQRTITQVPSHTHPLSISGSVNRVGDHTHEMASAGSHQHSLPDRNGGGGTNHDFVQGAGNGATWQGAPQTGTAGAHSHSLKPSGAHTHSLTIQGIASTVGMPNVDVTMPYLQLLACRRD